MFIAMVDVNNDQKLSLEELNNSLGECREINGRRFVVGRGFR